MHETSLLLTRREGADWLPCVPPRNPGMSSPTSPPSTRSTTLVRQWLAQSETAKPDPSAERLAGVLKDPRGLEFTLGFVDGVMRPEDLKVAGKNLEQLCPQDPAVPALVPAIRDRRRRRVRDPAALAHHPDRPLGAAQDGRPPRRRRDAEAPRQDARRSCGPTASASTSTCSARPCSASARPTAACRGPASCSPATTSTTCRSRCRASPASSRCGASTRPSTRVVERLTPLYEQAAASQDRRSSSTSTWRSTATWT